MEPGQEIADVIVNTPLIAVMTPNRAEPLDFYPSAGLSTPVVHLLYPNQVINNLAEWRNWRTWQVSVDRIEAETGLDFLTNIPKTIQDIIENRISNFPDLGLRAP